MTSVRKQLKEPERMGSSQKSETKILGQVTPRIAEAFVSDVANLQDNWSHKASDQPVSPEMKRLNERYPNVFSQLRNKPLLLLQVMDNMRHFLRVAWQATDGRHRDWYLFEMRRTYRDFLIAAEDRPRKITKYPAHGDIPELTIEEIDSRLEEPPPALSLEAILYYFQTRIRDRAKYCGNPDCPAPYFIAKKRWQKYCSEECAGLANREAKRRWWHENKGVGID